MRQRLYFCTSCEYDQLPGVLCLIESLYEQIETEWNLIVVSADPQVSAAFSAQRRPQIRCVVPTAEEVHPCAVAQALLTASRALPKAGALQYLAPELYITSPLWELHTENNRRWMVGEELRMVVVSNSPQLRVQLTQSGRANGPDWYTTLSWQEVDPRQWLSLNELPSDPLHTTNTGYMSHQGWFVHAIDYKTLHIIEAGTCSIRPQPEVPLANILHVLKPYLCQMRSAWVWLLSIEKRFEPPGQATPIQMDDIWFAYGKSAEHMYSLVSDQWTTIGSGWHMRSPQPLSAPLGFVPPRVRPCPAPSQYAESLQSSQSGSILVTALVSTYKSEKYMEGCLQDLVSQTLFQSEQLEIIVIDSASPENEREVVLRFLQRHPNIRYLRTEQREGLYLAWNRAAGLARGRFLTNANTDDRHHPKALELMAKQLLAHASVGLIYANSLITRTPNQQWSTASPVGELGAPKPKLGLLSVVNFVGPHPMWRKSLHQVAGYFDSRYTVAADYEMWLRFAEHAQIASIDQHLGLYLQTPDSIEHANMALCKREAQAISWAWAHWWPDAITGKKSTQTVANRTLRI